MPPGLWWRLRHVYVSLWLSVGAAVVRCWATIDDVHELVRGSPATPLYVHEELSGERAGVVCGFLPQFGIFHRGLSQFSGALRVPCTNLTRSLRAPDLAFAVLLEHGSTRVAASGAVHDARRLYRFGRAHYNHKPPSPPHHTLSYNATVVPLFHVWSDSFQHFVFDQLPRLDVLLGSPRFRRALKGGTVQLLVSSNLGRALLTRVVGVPPARVSVVPGVAPQSTPRPADLQPAVSASGGVLLAEFAPWGWFGNLPWGSLARVQRWVRRHAEAQADCAMNGAAAGEGGRAPANANGGDLQVDCGDAYCDDDDGKANAADGGDGGRYITRYITYVSRRGQGRREVRNEEHLLAAIEKALALAEETRRAARASGGGAAGGATGTQWQLRVFRSSGDVMTDHPSPVTPAAAQGRSSLHGAGAGARPHAASAGASRGGGGVLPAAVWERTGVLMGPHGGGLANLLFCGQRVAPRLRASCAAKQARRARARAAAAAAARAERGPLRQAAGDDLSANNQTAGFGCMQQRRQKALPRQPQPAVSLVEFLPLVQLAAAGTNPRACYYGLAAALGAEYFAVSPSNDTFSFEGGDGPQSGMDVPVDQVLYILQLLGVVLQLTP
jgi:hypothetical protein